MIYPQAQERARQASQLLLAGAHVCLFTNNIEPSKSDNAYSFTQAKCKPAHLNGTLFRYSEGEGVLIGTHPTVDLVMSDNEHVYGWFVAAVDGSLIAAERFATPINGKAGDSVSITPQIKVGLRG